MINNITTTDLRPQISVAKTTVSKKNISMPPLLGFKTPLLKEKANIRIKKVKRGDNIMVPGEIDDDYVDIVEEEFEYTPPPISASNNFFISTPSLLTPRKYKQQTKYLKNCYVVDFIQSPKPKNGLGTAAIKQLAEKAMFDPKIDGRIVTFSAPILKGTSPAIFFYKLGFRFIEPECNKIIDECIINNIPDIPPQVGMMYLPKNRLNKLLHYGELF